MNDSTNHFLMRVLNLFLWGGEMVGKEHLPSTGPAVFIANHLETVGPIAAYCSIPFRLYAWTIADMVDEKKAADWLRWDFVERTLELHPPVSAWVARWLSKITVPFLRSLGCIPVWQGDYDRLADTLRLSMNVLRQGKCLLIFPEDNRLPANPVTGMKPFQHSFARLGEKFFTETGGLLEFYPVAVHVSGYLMVGKVVKYDPCHPVGAERQRLKLLMENAIKTMYMQMENEDSSNMLTPQQNQNPAGEISR